MENTTKYTWAWLCNDAPAWTSSEEGSFDHCMTCIRHAVAAANEDGIYPNKHICDLMTGAYKAFQMAGYHYNTNVEMAEKFAELVKAAFNGEI